MKSLSYTLSVLLHDSVSASGLSSWGLKTWWGSSSPQEESLCLEALMRLWHCGLTWRTRDTQEEDVTIPKPLVPPVHNWSSLQGCCEDECSSDCGAPELQGYLWSGNLISVCSSVLPCLQCLELVSSCQVLLVFPIIFKMVLWLKNKCTSELLCSTTVFHQ